MKTRMINFIASVIVIVAGIIGVGIQANDHYNSVMLSKAITNTNNMLVWEEYKMGRNARLQRMVDSYVYRGEEDAPELVEANYWLNQIAAIERKLHNASKDEYAALYSSAFAEKDKAGWNVGRCLAAWSERTGRCAVSYGEGYCAFYFSYNEDGSRREKDIYFSNGREVNEYLASVRKAFPGI